MEERQYKIHYKSGINNTSRNATREKITESQVDKEITEKPEIQSSIGNQVQNEGNIDILTYKKYLECTKSEKTYTSNVSEVSGDLFKIEDNVHLAQCVLKNLKMSKGIAQQFRRKFEK